MGVIAMKTIRYGRQAKLPATELLSYALSLNGVHTAVVGLDSLNHLNEDAAVATGFRAMKTSERFEFHRNVSRLWGCSAALGRARLCRWEGCKLKGQVERS